MLSILIHRIVDLLQQDVGLHGLGNIVCCSRLHGKYSVLHFSVIGHYDEWGIDVVFVHPCEQAQSVMVGQTQV